MKAFFCIAVFLHFSHQVYASHAMGGEMTYNDLGNGKYQVILKVYSHCVGPNTGAFDGVSDSPVAYLTVFDGSGHVEGRYDLGTPTISMVPAAFNSSCVYGLYTICVEEGVYTTTLSLPPKTGGYLLVYQRCCRVSTVSNLFAPLTQGASYFTKIPGPEEADTNSSARFLKMPPPFICANTSLRLDHSAVDPDGDKLVYSLCAPYAGLDGCCGAINLSPSPQQSTCPSPPAYCPTVATAPPYTGVTYMAPFSGSYPLPSNPALAINPVTGQLTGFPTVTGQYIIGIAVQEYRNNILINTLVRDFQFTVIPCTVSVSGIIGDPSPFCQGQTVHFVNESSNISSTPGYHWDFGVSSTNIDTSNLKDPIYTYPDTGVYMVTLVVNPGALCTDTVKKEICVYPPLDVNYKHAENQCFKKNSFSFTTLGDYVSQTTYTWNFTGLATPGTSTLMNPSSIHFNQPGVYLVKLRAQHFACRDSFTDSVRVLRSPQAKINNVQKGLCSPAMIGFSNGSTGDFPLKYLWKFSDGTNSEDFEPGKVFKLAGTYAATLVAKDDLICKDTSIAILSPITVDPSPVAAFSISTKEASIFEPEIIVTSLASNDVENLDFYFGDGETSSAVKNYHSYKSFGDYKITQVVSNSFGCMDSTSDYIKILQEYRFWIPNSFTPDNNGRNDVFMPVVIGALNYEFEIFNSFGERIYHTTNPEEGWNGLYRGSECQQGIYAYKIILKNIATQQSETHLGHLTLIRNP